jgi:hypothetical protein
MLIPNVALFTFLVISHLRFTSVVFMLAHFPLFSCRIKRCPNVEYTFNH